MIDPIFNRRLTARRRRKHVTFLILRVLFTCLFRVLVRFRIYGLKNVPRGGGALVISNHVHNADPVLIEVACSRPVHFMAKVEIWKVPFVRWVANQTGAFPVRRGTADRAALRQAGAVLADGRLVGVFPEGTRSVTGGLTKGNRGVSMIATQIGAPLIPTVVLGSEDIPGNGAKQQKRKHIWPKVTILFGEPFHLETHKPDGTRWSLEDLSDAMMIEIARVLPVSHRGEFRQRSVESHPAVRRDRICFTGPEPEGILSRFRR